MVRRRNRFARGGRTQRGPRSIRPSDQLGTTPQGNDPSIQGACAGTAGDCCHYSSSMGQSYCDMWFVQFSNTCACMKLAQATGMTGIKGRQGGRVYQTGGSVQSTCPGGNYGTDVYGNQI